MKKSDWTTIVFVAVVSGFVAFMVTNSIMGDERKASESVKTTIVFSDKVDEPNKFVFRVDDSGSNGSINPTVPITTGNAENNKKSDGSSNTSQDSSQSSDPSNSTSSNNSSNSSSSSNSNNSNGSASSGTSSNQNSSRQDVF